MKKYIRTKTEIKEIETKIDNKELFDYLAQFNNYKDDLIKVADTIEELCDEIVVVNNWGKHTTQYFCDRLDRSTFVGNEKPCELNNTKVFGAIWTDKGLIYVAKMNDKGELELI